MKWLDVKRKLSTEDLISVEKEFKITLPEDFKEKIKDINGGALSSAYILVNDIGRICYSRNVPLDKETRGNIYDIGKYVMNDGSALFPIASDDFGNYFCFDLKDSTVIFLDHETDKKLYICDTFTELLTLIQTN